MSRLIDADALVIDYYDDYEAKDDVYTYPYVSESQIASAPSIDIVRCAECKYWRNADAEKIPTASIACGNMHADDFCSYGEREGE